MSTSDSSKEIFLTDPEEIHKVPLIAKERITWNTRRFRFALPTDKHVLGVPPGKYLYLYCYRKKEQIVRPYSALTPNKERGYFDLLIKIYFAGQSPYHPNGGLMSQYLNGLSIGDKVDIRGPGGQLSYGSNGDFYIKRTREAAISKINYKNVGMIAGGTGIAPLYRIMCEIIDNPEDQTKVWLIFANNTREDIIFKQEFEDIIATHGDQIKIWYTLVQGFEGWKYSIGYVNDEMIAKHMPPPADDTIILVCGPPPMVQNACIPSLDRLVYKENQRFVL